jgi:hypothetical protein
MTMSSDTSVMTMCSERNIFSKAGMSDPTSRKGCEKWGTQPSTISG